MTRRNVVDFVDFLALGLAGSGEFVMIQASQVKEHMDVVGSDGQHVGKVDHMDGPSRIKLAKSDAAAKGHHHVIPLDWVQSVEGQALRLGRTSEDVRKEWQEADATART
jgi:hypothetical protein